MNISRFWVIVVFAFSLSLPQTILAKGIMVCHKHAYSHGHRYYYCCRYHACYQPCCFPNPDRELDNACVDACIDLKHTLNQCMRSCSY